MIKKWLSTLDKTSLFVLLICLILSTIPFKLVFGSIATILFVVATFSSLYNLKFTNNKTLLLPIVLYFLMLVSVFWSTNTQMSLKGIQQNAILCFIPLCFLFLPQKLNEKNNFIFRLYSFSMVGFALFCLIKATFRYSQTGDKAEFMFHNLVTLDVNAIYVAAYASFCFFYFYSITEKKILDRISMYILAIFILLLYSKTIYFIDLLLLILYYIFYSKTKTGVKIVTTSFFGIFILLSVFFLPEVQQRISDEYETAFVDNTLNKEFGNDRNKVYNVSVRQAWNKTAFQPNDFFPGMAHRVFQLRIFNEIEKEKSIFWTGLGHNAADGAIKNKYKKYNLFKDYDYFNFHNQYVQSFAELGVFGFILVVLMVVFNLVNAWRSNDFLHIVFAITMLVLFMSESFFCRQRGLMFFVVLFCLFNGKDFRGKKQEARN